MERLGVGPDECLARNPKLVYGRMTGWGQEGPYAPWAGHDINYISLAGALAHYRPGRARRRCRRSTSSATSAAAACSSPSASCARSSKRRRAAQGQVVDTAMVDGTAMLMTMFWAMSQTGRLRRERTAAPTCSTPAPTSTTCTSAPTASTSRSARSSRSSTPSCCASPGSPTTRSSPSRWTRSRGRRSRSASPRCSRRKTRDEWCELMEHTDVCFAPVLTMAEAAEHPHNIAREMFVEIDGVTQPAPAPRFSRTAGEIIRAAGARRPAHEGGPRRLGRRRGPHRRARRGRRRQDAAG